MLETDGFSSNGEGLKFKFNHRFMTPSKNFLCFIKSLKPIEPSSPPSVDICNLQR